MRKGNILPIAIMAFAIVAFLLLIDLSISAKKAKAPVGNTSTTVANANSVPCMQQTKVCPDGTVVYGELFTTANYPSSPAVCTFAACPAGHANSAGNSNSSVPSTAGWKTYTNTTYGYSVKYPSTYALSGTDEAKNIDLTDYPNGNIAHITIYYYTGQNLDHFDAQIQGFIGNALAGTWDSNKFPDKQGITIGGKAFTSYDYDPGSSESLLYVRVEGKAVWLITDWAGKSSPAKPGTVLSTFTFISPTADWKTYTNSTYQISFQYPSNWVVTEGDNTTPFKIDITKKTGGGLITLWVGDSYSNKCGDNPVTSQSNVTIGGIPSTLYLSIDKKIANCKFRQYELMRTPQGWIKPTNGAYNVIQVMADDKGSFSAQDDILKSLVLQDATKDWKTYTNPQYPYQVSYPQSWQLHDSGGSVTGGKTYDDISFTDKYLSGQIYVFPISTGEDPETIFKRSLSLDVSGANKEPIVISGISGLYYRMAPSISAPDATLVVKNGLLYIIDEEGSDILTYSRLLSTFKFTD